MRPDEIADLAAFAAVAEQRSFTKAAARLGLSQSALSQIVRRLEERHDVRLLARTTRSVAPTEAGERLLKSLAPLFIGIEESVAMLREMRGRPGGLFRITSVEHAAKTCLLPKLAPLLREYPAIQIELVADYTLTDVVAERFDAGVRLGERVEKDMIAVRISPDIPMAVVCSPEYLAGRSRPEKPDDLIEHRCLNLRLPTLGTLNEWRFTRHGRSANVRVEGPMTFNTIDLLLDAALAGVGLAYLPLDQVEVNIASGRLIQVLAPWMQDLPGYHLYYPSRRQTPPAFKLVVDTLRSKAG